MEARVTISELIRRLAEIVGDHGDLPVEYDLAPSAEGMGEVEDVKVEQTPSDPRLRVVLR